MQSEIRIKYNKKSMLFLAGISFILCLFGTTDSLITHIVPIRLLRYGLIMVLIILECLYGIIGRTQKKVLPVTFMLCYMLVLPWLATGRTSWTELEILIYTSVILMCFVIIKKPEVVEWILNIVIIMCVFYAVTTIIFKFTPSLYLGRIVNLFEQNKDRLIVWYKNGCMAGMTGHYSTNGNFLLIGLLLSVAKYCTNKTKINKLLICLFIITLLMTGKRAQPIFGALAVFYLYYITISVKDKNALKRFFKIMIFVLVGAVAVGILMWKVPALATIVLRFQQSNEDGDISSGRFELWAIALKAFKKSPIFGIGWCGFRSQYSWRFSSERSYHVHNTYLQILCETGIIGFMVFMIWFAFVFFITIKHYKLAIKIAELDKKRLCYLSFSLLYQTFFLLYCITGNPLYDVNMFFIYFLCSGISLYYHYSSKTIPYLTERFLRKDLIRYES